MIRFTTARVALPVFFSAAALSLVLIQRPVLGVAASNSARTNPVNFSNSIGGLRGSNFALSGRQVSSPDISNSLLEFGKSLAPSAGLTVDQTMPNCITAPLEMSTFGPGPGGTLKAILAATVSANNASAAAYSAPPPPTYAVTIDVDSIPTGGGHVQVGCDHPSLINSPASSWPFNLSFPSSGSTSQTFYVTAATVTAPQTVHIYACEEDGDIADPSDWRVIATVTIVP